jgi:hypothetical protein
MMPSALNAWGKHVQPVIEELLKAIQNPEENPTSYNGLRRAKIICTIGPACNN